MREPEPKPRPMTEEQIGAQDQRLTVEEFLAVIQRLDSLVQAFETLPFPHVQEQIFEMLQAVDTIHREGLTRLITLLREEGQGKIVEQAAGDPVIETIFMLYGLIADQRLDVDGSPSEPNQAQQQTILLSDIQLNRQD